MLSRFFFVEIPLGFIAIVAHPMQNFQKKVFPFIDDFVHTDG